MNFLDLGLWGLVFMNFGAGSIHWGVAKHRGGGYQQTFCNSWTSQMETLFRGYLEGGDLTRNVSNEVDEFGGVSL